MGEEAVLLFLGFKCSILFEYDHVVRKFMFGHGVVVQIRTCLLGLLRQLGEFLFFFIFSRDEKTLRAHMIKGDNGKLIDFQLNKDDFEKIRKINRY